MASTVSRGNYYKKKTKDWFEKQGYTTQLTEFLTTRPIGGGKVIYVKKDVFGADGISMNGEEIIFWNSKFSIDSNSKKSSKSSGKKDFRAFPFPKCVKRQLIMWQLRSKQPIVIDC